MLYFVPPPAVVRAKGGRSALCAPLACAKVKKASASERGGSAEVLCCILRSMLLAPLFLWLKLCGLCLLVFILFCVGLAVWDMFVAFRSFMTGAQATVAGLFDNPFGILSLVASFAWNNDAVVDTSPLAFVPPKELPEQSWMSSLFWAGGRWWLQENARSLAALCPISFGATVLAMKRLQGR